MSTNKTHPLIRIVFDSKKYWLGMSGIILFGLLAGVFKISVAKLWGEVVDWGVKSQFDKVLSVALKILCIVFLSSIRTVVHYKIIGSTLEKMFKQFRVRIFCAIESGDLFTLERQMRSGDIAMRVGDDVDQLSDILGSQLANFVRIISQALFGLTACILLSWQLSIALLILLPLSLWLMQKISKPIQIQRKLTSDTTGKAMSLATDVMNGIATIKSYNLQKEMNNRFEDTLYHAYLQVKNTEKIGMLMSAVRYIFNVLQIMLLYLIGTWLVNQGTLTIGAVISFVYLSVYIKEMFEISDYMFRTIRNATGLAERLYEVLDLSLESDGKVETLIFDNEFIKMKNVSFYYGAKKENTKRSLNQIHLSLSKNQKIAFIGPSGCGKSTLIKLICRFYDHKEGEFTLFGVHAKDINNYHLRKQLALVSQDAILFDGTIYENVAYGRLDATIEEVLQAIKNAYLWDFVHTLPNGVHTQVGEGGSLLSGGQRQRICIARAMLKNAKIILLDEATAALDSQSERAVQLALDSLLENRAAVIVAHRLSTIQNVDCIYCLNEGEIIEEGTPAVLLRKKGYYYRMCVDQNIVAEVEPTL